MENKKIKIDPHVHSKGISLCSSVSYQEIVDEKKRLGYDGAILTNHCQKWYYPPAEHPSFIERIIEEYQAASAYVQTQNFRLWLGLEVSLHSPRYADWLLYGVTEAFLRQTPCLYALGQKQLFALCEKCGVLMIQAHPFREGQAPCDPEYMHGVEINCSLGDIHKAPLVEEFAAAHNLLVTCGTDYHHTVHDYFGGMLVGADCQSATDFAAEIRRKGETEIFLKEEVRRYAFSKNDK